MKKLFAYMVLLFLVAAGVNAATVTVVSGVITDGDNNPINGASVQVTCNHNNNQYVKNVPTGADGKYYAFFPVTECDIGDTVMIHAVKGEWEGHGEGIVSLSQDCQINVSMIDLQIPEFGVVAGLVAMLGALGIIIYRRNSA